MFVGEKVSQMGKASILVRYKCMHRRSCRPLSPWHYIILLSISTTQRRKGTLLPALALFFSHDHTHHLTLPNVICGNPLPSKGRGSLEQAANVGEPWRHRVHNILGVRERCKLTVIESKCKGENRRAFSFYGSTLPPGGGGTKRPLVAAWILCCALSRDPMHTSADHFSQQRAQEYSLG